MNAGKLFIFSAASGTGKTSLARALIERLPNLVFSVSHTTRAPRPGETHGVHYYFVAREEFERMIAADQFLEHARVFDNFYGTARAPVEQLLAQGKTVILDIDWQGARSVKKQMPQAVGIFLLPPSREALRERLTHRGQDSVEVIDKRMAKSLDEMSHYNEFDYVVVNDDFEAACADLTVILQGRPEKCRAATIDMDALLNAS
jgi:guanylate kinase